MDNLTINAGLASYTMPPQAYTMAGQKVSPGIKCIVPVTHTPDSSGVALLGDTFLRNFYSTYNFETNKVGLAVNSANPWDCTITPHMAGWAIFLVILAVLVTVVGGYVLGKRYLRKSADNNRRIANMESAKEVLYHEQSGATNI
jgi:uncharacterized protein YneF (UPF0154 family)